ncbi:hypothetical protein SAMN05216490_4049 [Mucilaginibacter mallensis]|uniref:Uncharacterized protein n=1 Tax=Mucilaginibacter mallensis TaxID=652787 RepID=A0A1H2BDY3_MUCMA|nr:hypothetical protein SAMN05216490_4049 [Mucilaginibacter mallensis]
MKKNILLFCFILFSCSTHKPLINNTEILQNHPKPVRIFGIGYWPPDYIILTLVDAKNEYFVIKTNRRDGLKVGDIWGQ